LNANNTALSLNEFDRFAQKYLVDWENKSTVRSQKRSRLQKEAIPEIIFPFFIKSYLKYPEVKALTNEQLAPFYLQSLCDMLNGVAQFEVNFVTDQCGKLANNDLGLELSDAIKQVAIAIGTDEMYHAFVARELLTDIKTLTGVTPTVFKPLPAPAVEVEPVLAETDAVKPAKPAVVPPLEYFKGAVTPELAPIAEATLLCILENAVVDDFFELAKDSTSNNPVSAYNREHLHDEGRHKVFFQRLLKYIWTNISEEDRVILGKAVAGYFQKYFIPHDLEMVVEFHKKSLMKLGISEESAKNIATQVVDEGNQISFHAKDHIKNPMRLMEFAGITQHEPTQQLFVKLGLLEDLVELA
jgi:hypothetical protein